MGLFSKKTEIAVPEIETDKYDLILRCSICSGEQILCMQDRKDGSLHELMLIRSFEDLKQVCDANNIDPHRLKRFIKSMNKARSAERCLICAEMRERSEYRNALQIRTASGGKARM